MIVKMGDGKDVVADDKDVSDDGNGNAVDDGKVDDDSYSDLTYLQSALQIYINCCYDAPIMMTLDMASSLTSVTCWPSRMRRYFGQKWLRGFVKPVDGQI